MEGRWTPHAAKQATWVVSHLTPGEVRRENGAFRYGLLARASGLDQLRYYGFGNETQNDKQDAFYRISDSQVTVFPTVSVGDGPKGSWTIGPIFRYSNTGRTRDDTLLAQEMPYGVGSFGEIGAASLYQLDTRAPDNVFSGGVSARLEGAVYPEAWDVESAFGSFGAELSGYIPLGSPALLSLNAGGRKVWGEVPFFEAAYIGGSYTTDGYHWNRFAGDASLYGSFELRWALRKIRFTVPGELGLTFRSDVGRVFLEREDSKRWHSSVSIAVFYAPFSGGSRSTSQTFDRASKRSLGLQAERLALFHADSCVDTEELPRTGDGPRLVFSRTSLL